MKELITNSYACQNATGQYYGSMDVNVTNVMETGTLPTCFFNLPVLDLTSKGSTAPLWNSPCWIVRDQNLTITSPTVGENYLPGNLNTAFDYKNLPV